jgi:hypothetical protein
MPKSRLLVLWTCSITWTWDYCWSIWLTYGIIRSKMSEGTQIEHKGMHSWSKLCRFVVNLITETPHHSETYIFSVLFSLKWDQCLHKMRTFIISPLSLTYFWVYPTPTFAFLRNLPPPQGRPSSVHMWILHSAPLATGCGIKSPPWPSGSTGFSHTELQPIFFFISIYFFWFHIICVYVCIHPLNSYNVFWINSSPKLLFLNLPPYFTILISFIILFSYMYIKYVDHIHPTTPLSTWPFPGWETWPSPIEKTW